LPVAGDVARKSSKGLSVRVVPYYDGTNDISNYRLDVHGGEEPRRRSRDAAFRLALSHARAAPGVGLVCAGAAWHAGDAVACRQPQGDDMADYATLRRLQPPPR
jgi:hypothetical protein